jgi:hypothetical protein
MSDLLKTLAQPKYRIPAATLAGFGIAGLIYYWRSKPNKTIGMDLILPGVVLACGLNLIGWLATDAGWIPVYGEAKNNGSDEGMGKLSKKAVNFLKELDENQLYKPMKKGGLKIAPVPDDPSVVTQE